MNPINKVLEIQRIVKNPFGDYPNLSVKEQLVGKLAVYGHSNDRIAVMTDYSLGAVNAYMVKICGIVGCQKHELAGKILDNIKAIVEEGNNEIHS